MGHTHGLGLTRQATLSGIQEEWWAESSAVERLRQRGQGLIGGDDQRLEEAGSGGGRVKHLTEEGSQEL